MSNLFEFRYRCQTGSLQPAKRFYQVLDRQGRVSQAYKAMLETLTGEL